MELRREEVYSRKHTGIYKISGNSGSLDREENDTIDDWIQKNSLGTVGWGSGKLADLLAASGTTYTIYSSMDEWSPPCPRSDGEIVKYTRRVTMLVSRDGVTLHQELENALKLRKLKKE